MHLFAIYLAFLRYVKHFENTHPNQNITDEMIKPRLKIQPLLKANLNVSKIVYDQNHNFWLWSDTETKTQIS